jgi:hypothetical protein
VMEDLNASSKFRVVGLVAQAARRFSKSINPPVTFGKPLSTSSSSPTNSGSGEGVVHKHHKKTRADFLFGPLLSDKPEGHKSK